MTGQLRNYSFRRVYEASESNLVDDFYVPALMRATKYDRAVGYFRSSVLHLVQIAISDFVIRGGKMRMICSTSLDDADEQTIRDSAKRAIGIDKAIVEEIKSALRDPKTLPVIELLATMVETGSLEVQVAYKANQHGIFHTKVGVFHDDSGDAVSFDGSANETFMAWAHNEERFKTFCTWHEGGRERVEDDQRYFDDLWMGKRSSIIVKPLPEVAKRILAQHACPDPQTAVEKVRTLAITTSRTANRPPKQLQDHQVAVLKAWQKTQTGIVDHVTGGGKTITAIACIREWFASTQKASVLVVVPSDLLTIQWRMEIGQELAALDVRILHAGGSRSHSQWPEYLRDYLRARNSNRPRLVIATMDTAATDRFLNIADVGDHTLMVVDEVHKVGAPSRCKVLSLAPGGKLGLSATPERFGDPSGTSAIFGFFGEVLKPGFSIRDAQNSRPKRLVPYIYQIGVVTLNAEEAYQYRKLTNTIGALVKQFESEGSQETKMMLDQTRIKRARIIKTAANKVDHGVEVIRSNYQEGQRWLVYCDTTSQLDSLAAALTIEGINSTRYLSTMVSSKVDTLDRFERHGGVLLSIRCLDEGIDIPAVSHALILASSTNPREHLQRRGRVLRTAPNKVEAEIHDTLVGMAESDTTMVFDHEVNRARSFAADARNERLILWRLDQLVQKNDPEWQDMEAEIWEATNE